jgi:hypothetical protein
VKNRFQNLPFKCNLQRYTAACLACPPRRHSGCNTNSCNNNGNDGITNSGGNSGGNGGGNSGGNNSSGGGGGGGKESSSVHPLLPSRVVPALLELLRAPHAVHVANAAVDSAP